MITESVDIRAECLRAASDEWAQPTAEEVREVLRLIAAARGIPAFTGGMAAAFLGLAANASGARTIRRWTGGATEIPYAAWALLCHEAGFIEIWRQTMDKEARPGMKR